MGVGAAAQEAGPPGTLTMTVAICTRGREDLLDRALRSLRAQQQRPAEVLVVDNAPSSEATRKLLAQQYPDYRYVREPLLGLDFARNRALREARHEIVAFLDDDAEADTDWAYHIWRTMETYPKAGLCTGRTRAMSIATDAERLFEQNGGYERGEALIRLPQDANKRLHGWRAPLIAWAVSVGNGTNFAIRRSWALELGGFDEAFELGEALHGGGDLDMFWRVLVGGHELVYQPRAQVAHQHRTTLHDVERQLADHQRALVAFLVKSRGRARGRMRFWLNAFIAWRLAKPAVRMFKRALRLDPLPTPMLWTMWRRAAQGLTIYPVAVRIAEQRRMDAAKGAA